MVETMQDVMDGDLPTEPWVYRDMWRQAVDLLSTLHEGIACLEVHIALVTAASSAHTRG
jgi:hypothetical protein